MASLFGSQPLFDAGNIALDVCLHSYDCHVDDARNVLVREFLKSDAHDLIFLDADIGWQSADLFRLAQFDRDVVAGVYPKRQDDPEFPVYWLGGELWAEPDGLLEVAGAPTGFMRIRRHVLEKLVETHRARGYRGQHATPDEPLYYPIFERIIDGGRRWSGDYAFCRKWRKLGGKIYVAPEMEFSHTGPRTWTGHLGHHLRAKAGLINPAITPLIHALESGIPTPRVFSDLFDAWANPWAATPELLYTIYNLALAAKGPILETGSGLSTLVLAAAAKRIGVDVHALEHDIIHADKTRRALSQLGLAAVVHYEPLRHYGEHTWYSMPPLLPNAFSLVICDGPPRQYGRDGLFVLLADLIRDAVIVMDDAHSIPDALRGRKVETLGETRPFLVAR